MNIMIVGAHGATAQLVTERLLKETEHKLVLFLRNANRLDKFANNPRVTLVDGDVLNTEELATTMQGQDLIYSNVGGVNLADQTRSIIQAMDQANVNRLLFISALGAHHEVPGAFGKWNEEAIAPFLPGFRESANLLETSDINYTMIRPSWMTDKNEVDYELSQRDEPMTNTEISRKSIADFVFKLIQDPTLHQHDSIGISKPGTEGDKPAWM